jgi:hypothetical protein
MHTRLLRFYAFRNQPNEAFEWLDRAYGHRDSGLIKTKVDPLLKRLQRYAIYRVPEQAQLSELSLRCSIHFGGAIGGNGRPQVPVNAVTGKVDSGPKPLLRLRDSPGVDRKLGTMSRNRSDTEIAQLVTNLLRIIRAGISAACPNYRNIVYCCSEPFHQRWH